MSYPSLIRLLDKVGATYDENTKKWRDSNLTLLQSSESAVSFVEHACNCRFDIYNINHRVANTVPRDRFPSCQKNWKTLTISPPLKTQMRTHMLLTLMIPFRFILQSPLMMSYFLTVKEVDRPVMKRIVIMTWNLQQRVRITC